MKVLGQETIRGHEVLVIETDMCPVCTRTVEMNVNPEHFQQWQEGAHIQTVMPYLSSTEREALISGVCSDGCWDKLWGATEF